MACRRDWLLEAINARVGLSAGRLEGSGGRRVSGASLTELPLRDRYATNRDDLIRDFYEPCLNASVSYDRAAGYFRSSILLLSARAVADLAAGGGKIRLICSPELTGEDIDALEEGYDRRQKVGEVLRGIMEEALGDQLGGPVVEFLATLIEVGSLDVRIAFRLDGRGIFHDKIGVFRDAEGHAVSFTGSVNETLSAWDPAGNHESFDVFRSWTAEAGRVQQHVEDFERLWEGREPGVETIPFPQVARERLVTIANPEGVEAAYRKSRALADGRRWKKRPRAHQLAAIKAWKLQNQTGDTRTRHGERQDDHRHHGHARMARDGTCRSSFWSQANSCSPSGATSCAPN